MSALSRPYAINLSGALYINFKMLSSVTLYKLITITLLIFEALVAIFAN